MKASKAWDFNLKDAKIVAKNALIFLAPVIITELTLLQSGTVDLNAYLAAFQVWVFGVLIDFFRKLKAGK